jgi:nickel-dependent lactate racemase
MPKVAYGTEGIDFNLQPGDSLTEKEPADDIGRWQSEEFRRNLSAARFEDILACGKPLIVVNDAYRPTPTGQVLSQIKTLFPTFYGDFIIACGNHPPPDNDDLAAIFDGYKLPDDAAIFTHDSRDYDSMLKVGECKGHPLFVNRLLFEYPAVILIGSVEPHYFAGYTGGRKSLFPGLGDIKSCRRNHALAVDEDAQPLRLKGNPVAEHLDQLAALIKLPNYISIQIVTGRNQKIINCFAGSLLDSFNEAVMLAEQVYSFKCPKQYDMVIAEMRPPLDRNLYQLQKAIENTTAVVRDGGTILAVSECREGIGNDEFYQLASRLKNEEMVSSHSELDNPPLGIHKLSRIVRMKKTINVKALTGLKHEILEQVFIEPAVSIEAEVQKLKEGSDKEIDILLVRDAGLLAARLE